MKTYTDVMNEHLHVLKIPNQGHNFPASVRKQWLLEQCPKRLWGGKFYFVCWENLGIGVWRAYLSEVEK